jgi:hypothetical protein
LSIDDDVAALVELEMRQSGESLKGTVNRLLRQGLMASSKPESKKTFVIQPFPLGVGEMLDRHNGKVSALLDELEGPGHR